MTREFIDFVNAHKDEDTARLLLSAARYPSIDMPAAVQQIEGRRTAREKWPSFLHCDEFLFPPRLNREQASSEATAQYKASLLRLTEHYSLNTAHLADLTGGMGIDTIAFARTGAAVDYVERNEELCSLMEHNCRALGLDNIHVHCADSMEWLESLNADHCSLNTIYIDPARRSASGHKVAAFEDCEPNILQHLPLLRERCQCLIVKASPMIDIDLACRQLGCVKEVHVVAVNGECKEVLFHCGPQDDEPQIYCASITSQAGATSYSFTRSQEAAATPCFCTTVGRYLYEPDAALMKGGPYNLICLWFGMEKLARNTHLYTSDERVGDFPGRVFEVVGELKLSRRDMAAAIPEGKAHVVTRNYPVDAAALQRQLGLKEGGDLFVVATTVGTRRCGFLCKM